MAYSRDCSCWYWVAHMETSSWVITPPAFEASYWRGRCSKRFGSEGRGSRMYFKTYSRTRMYSFIAAPYPGRVWIPSYYHVLIYVITSRWRCCSSIRLEWICRRIDQLYVNHKSWTLLLKWKIGCREILTIIQRAWIVVTIIGHAHQHHLLYGRLPEFWRRIHPCLLSLINLLHLLRRILLVTIHTLLVVLSLLFSLSLQFRSSCRHLTLLGLAILHLLKLLPLAIHHVTA